MTDVFLEREWDDPLDLPNFAASMELSEDCFGLHRVSWCESLLSADGKRMLCHFSAPDAESVRIALQQYGVDLRIFWPGTVHDAPQLTDEDLDGANVVVERSFAEPVALDDIQAIEDENIGCLRAHRVRFVRTFFSSDRRRMLCLYAAPDAESVRIAQREARMPFDRVWPFRMLTSETL